MVYTEGAEFEWDDGNVDHIARHGIEPWEAEEAFEDPARRMLRVRTRPEIRYALWGRTTAGRLVVMVFVRRGRQIRVVTARDATDREERQYDRRK